MCPVRNRTFLIIHVVRISPVENRTNLFYGIELVRFSIGPISDECMVEKSDFQSDLKVGNAWQKSPLLYITHIVIFNGNIKFASWEDSVLARPY